jgi:hypothetical protein
VLSVVRKIDQFSLHTAGSLEPAMHRAARPGLRALDVDIGSTAKRDFAADSLQVQQTAIRRFNC